MTPAHQPRPALDAIVTALAISDTTALVAVSVDDGTYTGRAWIRTAEVSIG